MDIVSMSPKPYFAFTEKKELKMLQKFFLCLHWYKSVNDYLSRLSLCVPGLGTCPKPTPPQWLLQASIRDPCYPERTRREKKTDGWCFRIWSTICCHPDFSFREYFTKLLQNNSMVLLGCLLIRRFNQILFAIRWTIPEQNIEQMPPISKSAKK